MQACFPCDLVSDTICHVWWNIIRFWFFNYCRTGVAYLATDKGQWVFARARKQNAERRMMVRGLLVVSFLPALLAVGFTAVCLWLAFTLILLVVSFYLLVRALYCFHSVIPPFHRSAFCKIPLPTGKVVYRQWKSTCFCRNVGKPC